MNNIYLFARNMVYNTDVTNIVVSTSLAVYNFFITFNSSCFESGCNNVFFLLENLLDGLENWLDRLFEGSTHRYYVNYWPDMTTK
jgi:hypothetical protein